MDPAADAHPENLGAYALDALDPAEAELVRRHADGCPECRQQIDELAEARGMLDSVPLEALLDASPDGTGLLP
jgi:anti-sigma factor RsiW